MVPKAEERRGGSRGAIGPLGALAIVGAVFAAYAPVLDNFFQPIDDPTILWGVREGYPLTPHLRPLFAVWNRILLSLFGLEPFGYYLTGLLLHAGAALAVARLAGWTCGERAPALAAGLVFAASFSPHETMLWISANCGLLCVLFVLLGGLAWTRYLDGAARGERRRWLAYAGALGALALAMGFKEDCVLAGPLFLGLDLARRGLPGGVRGLARRLAPYAAPALMAGAYLMKAARPDLWEGREDVGQYRFELGLIPEALGALALLFWPRSGVDALGPVAIGAGVVVVVGAALLRGPGSRLARLGLALGLFGLLPTLPGPFPLAGTRYAYPSTVGVALLAAGVLQAARARPGRTLGALAGAGLVVWLAAGVLAIRSVERWRFQRRADQLRAMVMTTEAVVSAAPAAVIAPPVMNARDYFLIFSLWYGIPRRCLTAEDVPHDGTLLASLRPGAELDPQRSPVFGVWNDGEVFRLSSGDEAIRDHWDERAAEAEALGRGWTLAVVRIRGADTGCGPR